MGKYTPQANNNYMCNSKCNNDEFPNDNSEKSTARLRAFKMCCNFLDLIKK